MRVKFAVIHEADSAQVVVDFDRKSYKFEDENLGFFSKEIVLSEEQDMTNLIRMLELNDFQLMS